MALVLLLLFLLTHQACSQGPTWLRIDCGAASPYYDYSSTGLRWQSDASYISTGHNAQVQEPTDILPNQMNSLRFFPDQNKNCYTLPASDSEKYQVRAAFYYGNYDGKNNPPTFDLSLNGNSWATVDTSDAAADQPFSQEAIIVAKGRSISVCVSRTKDDEVPFVSTIDMVHLSSDMYGAMDSNYALFTENRFNYGSITNEAIWYPQDLYARIWVPADVNYTDVYAPTPQNEVPDIPPSDVLVTGVEAQASDNLILSLNLSQPKSSSYYLNLYFNEPEITLFGTRTFDIYLDGEDINITVSTTSMQCLEYYVITNPIVGSLELTLVPTATSDYPPFISALELFAVSPKLVNGTYEDDLTGLEQLVYDSQRLSTWTGDPCLPTNTAWEWLRCNEDDPPRVTALYLAGYGLKGPLRDFSQMQALEIIDLHNNSLSGPIPDFLGKLPNLKELNLANNDFTGSLPDSLANNKKIKINTTGNTDLEHSGKSHIALIVGLSVGAFIFVVICLLFAFILYRIKVKKQEETTVEHGVVEEEAQVGAGKEDQTVRPDPDESEHMSSAELQRQMELELGNLIHEHVQATNGNVL